MCVDLGIKNIHVHKGPTIWPLDKDAFDVSDVDHVATDYNGQLNFIVEHVGLPRIEDFCFMATQEPNVYAGLSVVVGGLMHARPNFFAKVMGELLFWVGEDKMLFGSDYAIWEPKWQIEGFLNWEMPDEPAYADFPRLGETASARSSASTPPSSTTSRCPAELRGDVPAEEPATEESAVGVAMNAPLPSSRAARDGLRPGARRADHHARLRRLPGRDRGGDVSVRLRLPTPQCAPNFAFLMAADARAAVDRVPGLRPRARSSSRITTRATEINAAIARGDGFSGAFPGETRGELDALRALFQRKALVARQGRLLAVVRRPGGRAARASCPGPTRERCRELRAELGYRRVRRRSGVRHRRRRRRSPTSRASGGMASLTALSLETNGGMCRDLLRVRYSEEGVAA